MLAGQGYEVIGVSVAGPAPLGRVHLKLEPGVTALYGLNGSGKSRLLRALHEALTGDSPDGHALVNREVTVAINPANLHVQKLTGWLHEAKRAAAKAVVENVTARSITDRGADLAVHLWSPPVDLREALAAMADAALWIEPDDLAVEVASSGTVVVSTDKADCQLRVAATTDTILETGPEDVLWGSLFVADEIVSMLLERPRELTGRRLVLDLASLLTDRYLDPTAIRDIEAGDLALNSHRPGWSAIPFGKGGSLGAMPVEVFGERLTTDTLRERTLEAVGVIAKKVISIATDEDVELTPEAAATISQIEQRAHRFAALLLRDAPALRLRLGIPDEWLSAAAPTWEALDQGTDTWLDLDELSSAQHRWCSLAVDLAIAEARGDGRPFVVLLDEPETGLHRAAEHHLATGLKQLAVELRDAAIIVASHSPEFLADPGMRVVHIQRAYRGLTIATGTTVDLNDALEAERAMSNLGLTRTDLLHLARVVVVVEGSHDIAVLRAFGDRELSTNQAFVAKMLGARNASAVLDAQMLMTMSDAMVLVVVDAISAKELEPMWAEIQVSASTGDLPKARRSVGQLRRLGTPEADWLAELADRTITVGRLDRLHLTSLAEADIILYLDPSEFGLQEPWPALQREWLALPRKGRPRFKEWLREEKGAKIGVQQVERAASAVPTRPADFERLFERIHELSLHPR